MAVLAQPAAVVLAPAFGRRLVHGLQPLDADARVARRGEAGVGQHVVEAVPDDDVLGRQAALAQPGDDGVDHLQAGGDQSGADRVDLDAHDILFVKKQLEALSQRLAGQGLDPLLEHGGHDLAVHPLFVHGLLVLDPDHLAGKEPGQGMFRARHGHGLVDVGLGLGGRLHLGGLLPEQRRPAQQQSRPQQRAAADLEKITALQPGIQLDRTIPFFLHQPPPRSGHL